jgi:hypothetical protein
MPLIKDKDRYKKLSARNRGRSQITQPLNLPNKQISSPRRKRIESIDTKRSEEIINSVNSSSPRLNYIKPTVNTVTNIVTLKPGDSLINLLVANAESTGNCDIHWSFTPSKDLTFTTSSGVITAVSGGQTMRVNKNTLTAYEVFTLGSLLNTVNSGEYNNNRDYEYKQFSLFDNVGKTIYFYFVSNVSVDITYGIS